MGIDLCTYRARIGCFVAHGQRTSDCSPVWLRPALVTSCLRKGGRCSVVLFCIAHLIICAGDVETKPGPDKVEQILALVKDFTLSNEKFQKDTSNKLKDIQISVTDIKRRLSTVEERLNGVAKLAHDVTTVNSVVQESHEQLKTIETKQLEQANLVVDELNNRMCRNNLIFKGVPEEPDEKWVDTERIINDFVRTNLGFNAGEIERAHRIGRPKADQIRPVIVKFLNFKDKTVIVRNASKLKDLQKPRVWIEEDFSARMQPIKKKLRDFARKERNPNEKYAVIYDKLLLGNKCYTFDSSINEGTCLSRRDEDEVAVAGDQGAISAERKKTSQDD
ncbi:hypothetical protein HPB48_000619 [Haemaphysalis longicornis]|uniref:Uncharacterized protein n=1 Tax=Haemaphysalis longicornis TaxID=44386 RepID=A0A9J6FM15_HAELO|nr:hypothetical protein HPB48_000619 [Haemaphysalis longicornis]